MLPGELYDWWCFFELVGCFLKDALSEDPSQVTPKLKSKAFFILRWAARRHRPWCSVLSFNLKSGWWRGGLQVWSKQKDMILQKVAIAHSKTGVVKIEF